MANRKCTVRRVSFSTPDPGLGDLDSGLEGAESAKREETPWSVFFCQSRASTARGATCSRS